MCCALLSLLAGMTIMLLSARAGAAEDTVRIAQQFGLSYLPLSVAIERKLIEKHASAAGIPNSKVEIVRLASGAAVNDAIISGSVDVAMAGLTVLINLWDKTATGTNPVKGLMAISDSPIYFNTVEQRIKTASDFQPDDKIGMTAGRTQHAVVLQMAAATAFGWQNRTKLDSLVVSTSHPDGVIGLLSGGSTFKTHATTVPFIQMELASPSVRTILNSYDVTGGRHTLIVAYAASRWQKESPALFGATFAALEEAMTIIQSDRRAAAELYLATEPSKLTTEMIQAILADENMLHFTPTPSKVMLFADYMAKVGWIKNRPESWKDVFFEIVHDRSGN
jgi:NitT/TauT family transport system substrate-binding protein